MRKFKSNGALIKRLREESDQFSLQKEFSYKIGVSERQLRGIENNNAKISRQIADRISGLTGAPWHKLIVNQAPQTFHGFLPEIQNTYRLRPVDGMLHVPRYETTYACAVKDAGSLLKKSADCFTVVRQVHTELTEETERYANDLIEILSGLTRPARGYSSAPIDGEDELSHRVRDLFILLKGNDVWIYVTDHNKRLPESDAPVLEWDARSDMQLIVAFGPPGEYGEETIEVQVDNGHPFSIPYDIQPVPSVAG